MADAAAANNKVCWIGRLMANGEMLGYGGLFLGSFLAPTILPMSSEAVLAAMVIGGFDPVVCVVVASAGNSLGGNNASIAIPP